MSCNDEQRDLDKTAPELEPSFDTTVTCRLKPDRRRPSATLDHWTAAIKGLKGPGSRSDNQ